MISTYRDTKYPGFIVFLLGAVFLSLAGCASGPKFDREQFHQRVTPKGVVDNVDSWQNDAVLWGGMIVGTRNLDNGSQVEVLAYPLRRSQLPDTSVASAGRFLAVTDEFLEPADYAEGRLVTLTGIIEDTVEGKVGSATNVYPLIQVEQIHLWPKGARSQEPSVHFGFGFIFSN